MTFFLLNHPGPSTDFIKLMKNKKEKALAESKSSLALAPTSLSKMITFINYHKKRSENIDKIQKTVRI